MNYLILGAQALFIETAGVLLVAGGFYLFDKLTTKKIK